MNAHAQDQAFKDWVDRAKEANILDVAKMAGARLKPSGVAEYFGPCPFCKGTDRFSVNTRERVWNCRGGMDEKTSGGSVIDLYMHAQQCSFVDAVEAITHEPRPNGVREETQVERLQREARTARRQKELAEQEERDERAAEARKLRDEAAVADVLSRAVAIEGTHGDAYMRGRGLIPVKRLLGDIRFVKNLDYWGYAETEEEYFRRRPHLDREKASRPKTLLAVLPAVVAVIRDVTGQHIIGISQTYLDPVEPRKWTWVPEAHLPPKKRENRPKKIRGEKVGGLIRLGALGEKVAEAEGWENTYAWDQLRRQGVFGDNFAAEEISLAAAVDLGNLSGGWTATQDHPFNKRPDGRPTPIPNGVPDMEKPGAILPAYVKSLILLGDGDSERIATMRAVLTGARRHAKSIKEVFVDFSPTGLDWNSYAQALAQAERIAA